MAEIILSLEKAAMERWRNGDPMGFVEISAEDLIYVDPGLTRPILGLDEFKTYMQAIQGKVHYQKSEFIDPKVVMVGDVALLSYNYCSSVLGASGVVLSRAPWNATEIYFRRNDAWKIVHTHWSHIHHKSPDQVEIPLPVSPGRSEYEGVLGELMTLEAAAMERWRKGDPGGYIELLAPEMTYFDPGTPQRINGKQALVAVYKSLEGKIFYPVMDFVNPQVLTMGDMAVLFYRFLSTKLDADGSVASRTPWNCTEVYQRMQGSWWIIHNHWSHIRGVRD